ncbi:hypothetical protein BT96DRAFT_93027 [Gymnopus androsaceus JB14]|uniref:F-box domain-containing protein n=1 Tax=Gymnopus androsaceus JB14 TaxID=1447944 RepID=A0A6A4HER1_9AGAR|nr:hypothetical protein BT96DRAFT_93027 [Gymnopus androsaceus JB14]
MLVNTVRGQQPRSLKNLISQARLEPFAYSPEEIEELRQACNEKSLTRYPLSSAGTHKPKSLPRNWSISFGVRHSDPILGRQYKRILKGFSSPIRKLPTELLLIIFHDVCQWNLLHCVDSPADLSFLPVLSLGSTCIQWRTLATLTPSLWSCIQVKIAFKKSPKNVKAFTNFKLLLRLFLGRSKEWPLMIDLIVPGEDHKIAAPAIKLLLQHCRRWEYFRYEGDLRISAHIALGFHFDTLREICMKTENYNTQRLEPFARAPNLATLVMPGATFDFTPPPFFQGIDVCTGTSFLCIVKVCPTLANVTKCKCSWSDPSNLLRHARTTVDDLHSLRIRLHETEEKDCLLMDHILAMFSFPALTELEIMTVLPGQGSSRIWPLKLFHSFLETSSRWITKFVLRGVRISTSELAFALRSLPSLMHLHISDKSLALDRSPITRSLICLLYWSPERDHMHVVPRLRSLCLEFYGDFFDDTAFGIVVQSRRVAYADQVEGLRVECLQAVVLRFFARKVDKGVYEHLRSLQRRGMMLMVSEMGQAP